MSAASKSAPRPRQGDAAWLSLGERGSLLGMRAFVWLLTVGGRRPARLLLRVVILYYALFFASARRASRQWLERVFARSEPERRVRFRDVYRHLLRFGQVTLDRLLLVQGRTAGLRVERHGGEHIEALLDSGRGALLLGAHLGSFEALRLAARGRGMKINVLAYVDNARMINALLERLSPPAGGGVRLLSLGDGRVEALLEAGEAIERGEVVAMLGDRIGLNDKSATVDFLGQPARLPTGPYILAALLKCPVYLTFGLYRDADSTYALHCEPFAERIVLPRGAKRQAALEAWAARYAQRLEHHAALAPDNWFNFYDFWSAPDGTR